VPSHPDKSVLLGASDIRSVAAQEALVTSSVASAAQRRRYILEYFDLSGNVPSSAARRPRIQVIVVCQNNRISVEDVPGYRGTCARPTCCASRKIVGTIFQRLGWQK
jgi:hypothetical protein